MYKHNNYGKFIDTERKYSPAFIGDLIFPNAHVKSVVTAYASGEVRRPLILCGRGISLFRAMASLSIPTGVRMRIRWYIDMRHTHREIVTTGCPETPGLCNLDGGSGPESRVMWET